MVLRAKGKYDEIAYLILTPDVFQRANEPRRKKRSEGCVGKTYVPIRILI